MPRADEVFSVSQIAEKLRHYLEREYYSVWVSGEVTNCRRSSAGHLYFSLKDANAQLGCVFFRGNNCRLRFQLRDGLQVLARGMVTYYAPTGDTNLNVYELQPKGIGPAELALRQLKEKLLARGYFDPQRKRSLPSYPKRVGLVASAQGAAIRDMLELLAQRWPLAEVIVVHSRVQGDGAGLELARALRLLAEVHQLGGLTLDAIILGRGGGSVEDLAAFNEEILADAIFQSPVPVVSAVGHETDVTIADLVADHRAETPSAAVMKLTPNVQQIMEDVKGYHHRMTEAMTRRLNQGLHRIEQITQRPAFRRPLDRFIQAEGKLRELARRLDRAITNHHTLASERLAALSGRLETLSPLQVLHRGYSLTFKARSRALIRHPDEVRPGQEIVTQLVGGEILSLVRRITLPGSAQVRNNAKSESPGLFPMHASTMDSTDAN